MEAINTHLSSKGKWWSKRELGYISLALCFTELFSIGVLLALADLGLLKTAYNTGSNEHVPFYVRALATNFIIVGPTSILFAITGIIWDTRRATALTAFALTTTIFFLVLFTQTT